MFCQQWTWWRIYSLAWVLFFVLLFSLVLIGWLMFLAGYGGSTKQVVSAGLIVIGIVCLAPIVFSGFVLAISMKDGNDKPVSGRHLRRATFGILVTLAAIIVLDKLGDFIGFKFMSLGVLGVGVMRIWLEPLIDHPYTKGLMPLRLWRHRQPLPLPDGTAVQRPGR